MDNLVRIAPSLVGILGRLLVQTLVAIDERSLRVALPLNVNLEFRVGRHVRPVLRRQGRCVYFHCFRKDSLDRHLVVAGGLQRSVKRLLIFLP